jgi:hypothetical protein
VETSLHRRLKQVYAPRGAEVEVVLGKYRIDVVQADQLVEIQHGSLAAIRDKVRRLLEDHRVLVVKPIVHRKRLITLRKRGGPAVRARLSPKRGALLDLFDELVYFTRVFPHPNLTLEVTLVDVEEYRYPGHGRRRWRRARDHVVEDRKLVKIHGHQQFQTAEDLARIVPTNLPQPFHTGHLAAALNVERHIAQRIAYCFRHMGTTRLVGKQGNALLYQFT